jgi:hypothetical protein
VNEDDLALRPIADLGPTVAGLLAQLEQLD